MMNNILIFCSKVWFIVIKLKYLIRVIKIIEIGCYYYYTLESMILLKNQNKHQVIKKYLCQSNETNLN